MPVHFNSFIPDNKNELKNNLFANIVKKYTENADDIFVSNDKKKIHMTSYYKDTRTGEKVGKVVITLLVKEKEIEIVDTDITLLNNNKIRLHFEKKLEESSESNEYYEVYPLEDIRHFQIETVNRYFLEAEEIEETDQDVFVSLFPFQLEVFINEEELNKRFGYGKEIDIPEIGRKVIGLDPQMMAPGNMIKEIQEPCSFIIGFINDYKDVEVDIADCRINFTIIYLETAIGIVPVAVNRENFDLRNIEKNKIVCMFADVKADFKK